MSNKVSIIIPTFNGSKTIKQTIESVLQQEYTDYEIIIVDDGSTDSTVELVKKLLPSARIVQQQNQGTLSARQAGVNVAQGDLIAFLDQDDLWFKENLRVEVDVLNKYPETGLVLANMQAIDDVGDLLGFNVVPDAKCYTPSWEELLLLHPIANSVALLRKDVVIKMGGLDIGFGFSGALGDSDTFARMSEITNIHFINQALGRYRWSETRPGRLIGFLDNLQIYARKYWGHPRLSNENNIELRTKFVQACCNYALHIYRLLLKQYNNRIPGELLLKLSDHNRTMENLFGNLYRSSIGLKSFDPGIINFTNDAPNTLLFLYLLRMDLQKAFPQAIHGDLDELLEWGGTVASGRCVDGDFTVLSQFASVLKISKNISAAKKRRFFNVSRPQSAQRYRQLLSSIIKKILPMGSKRRRLLNPILTGVKIILAEGWISFWRKLIQYIGIRLQIAAGKVKKRWQLLLFDLNVGTRLVFPYFDTPCVAIVVRISGDKRDTHECLCSLLMHSKAPYRVIALCSESPTVDRNYLNGLKNIITIENPEKLTTNIEIYRLLRAQITNEKYVLFITDDIVVTNGYLEQMLGVIEHDDGCGAVSCKMIDLSGKFLLEAGGIVRNDGKPFIYGFGDNPNKPEYSYVRSVDFGSSDCILVRKNILDNFCTEHQFSDAKNNLYKLIKESGYAIKYQPASVVLKRNVESLGIQTVTNLQGGSAAKNKLDYLIVRSAQQKAKILVMDDYIPAIRYGSGFPRLYEMLSCLAELGYSVTFFPVGNPVKVQPETSALQQKGVEIFWDNYANFEQFAQERSGHYDIVLISRPHVFERLLPTVEEYFSNAAILYDAEALFYTREILKSEIMGSKIDDEEKIKMAQAEMRLIEMADLVISVSQKTKEIMQKNSPQENIEVWEHIQDTDESGAAFKQRDGILFFGGFFAGPGSPNEDAALFFAREIFPEIRKTLACKLYIVGASPTSAVKELVCADIEVTGYVENPSRYFNTCKVNVVPTRFAAGIPLKLLEVMSCGIPSVVSELIADQLSLFDNNQVLVANNASEFATKVVHLYLDEDLWNMVNRNSLDFVKNNFSRSRMREKLDAVIAKGLKIKGEKKFTIHTAE